MANGIARCVYWWVAADAGGTARAIVITAAEIARTFFIQFHRSPYGSHYRSSCCGATVLLTTSTNPTISAEAVADRCQHGDHFRRLLNRQRIASFQDFLHLWWHRLLQLPVPELAQVIFVANYSWIFCVVGTGIHRFTSTGYGAIIASRIAFFSSG